jgi:hypothetical protein
LAQSHVPEKINRLTILICPNCDRRGVAEWTAPVGARTAALETFSAGFLAVDDGKQHGPHFECFACRIAAKEVPAP